MSERIVYAITSSDRPPRDLAKEIGISVARISQLKAGLGGIKAENLFALARATSVSPRWLAEGVGKPKQIESPQPSHALISRYTAKIDPETSEHDHRDVAFDQDWLTTLGLDVRTLKFMCSTDDTMEPTLNDGDVILIDESQREPENRGIYVVLRGDGVPIIKRLLRTMTSGWIIRSDNQDKRQYPDEIVSDTGIADLRIAGRVVWHGGAL